MAFFGMFLFSSCSKENTTEKAITPSANIETRTNGCGPSNDPECQTLSKLWVLKNDLFPGCEFLISVDVTYCGVPATAVSFSDFKVVSHDCPAYTTYLTSCMANITFETCMHTINVNFQDALAIQALTQSQIPISGTQISVYYYFATCSQYCFFNNITEENPQGFLDFTKMPCTDGCCKRTALYSKTSGEWKKISSQTDQVSGVGCEYVIQAPNCPANSFWVSGCIMQCIN